MIKILVIGIIIVLVVLIVLFILFSMMGPDLKKLEGFKEPQIIEMPSQKMIIVESAGDPNIVGKQAIGELFKTYYGLNVDKSRLVASRARWPKSLTTQKSDWIGIYAMPIPDAINKLPENSKAKIGIWEYGKVAQILHIGPYSAETPTIDKLLAFIKNSGYSIIGDHEEEYVKGPGMFSKGDPNKYYTLIRYRIVKK